MHIEINNKALEGKLETIAAQDGVPVEQVAVDIIHTALADEEAAVRALEDFLQPRIDRAHRGETVDTTVEEIFDRVDKEFEVS